MPRAASDRNPRDFSETSVRVESLVQVRLDMDTEHQTISPEKDPRATDERYPQR